MFWSYCLNYLTWKSVKCVIFLKLNWCKPEIGHKTGSSSKTYMQNFNSKNRISGILYRARLSEGGVATLVSNNLWNSKSHGKRFPRNPNGSHGTQKSHGLESHVLPKLGIWLSKRFLSRDCPSDICPCPKRPRRISPNPGPKSRDSCPETQILWDSSPFAHPWFWR